MRTTSKETLILFLICLVFAAAISVSGQQTRSSLAAGAPAGRTAAPIQDAKGALKVLSEPAGAEITINGKPMGVTPLKIVNINAGEYRVALHLQGYLFSDTSVRISANETQSLSLPLKPAEPRPVENPPAPLFCTLTVKTTPPGATLFINDQPSGITPYHNDTLAPGTYKLRMEMPGYDPIEGSGALKAGETRLIEKKLIGLYGTLSVTTTPSGAALSINDQPSGATPFRNEKLAPGNYNLFLELPGYSGISENIVVARDTVINRQYALLHSKAWLDSVGAFKLAKYRHGRVVRRVWFGILTAAAAGTGYYFETRVAAAAKKQSRIQAEYRAATTDFNEYLPRFDDAGKEAKDDAKARNILYGFAGAFGFGFVISIPF